MKKLLTFMLAATLVFAASESSLAQKKKKKKNKKEKVTPHGEKSVKGGKFNERKNIDPSAGPSGSSGKRKKGKKSKNTSFAPLKHQFDLFYTYAKKEGNEIV